MKNNVLVLCHDTIGLKMAGPGIRYQNIAEQIKRVANVTLGIYSDTTEEASDKEVRLVKKTGNNYRALFDQHDIIFAQWLSGEMLSYAQAQGKVIIIDLYAPVPVEYLASQIFSTKKLGAQDDLEFSGVLETYKQYLSSADFFVCSNDRQRDFWLGFIMASNILRPSGFRKSAKMNNLALCPMGIEPSIPTPKELKLRNRAGLNKDDFVLLWTGGIWDWFDAQVVIKAVGQLDNPRIKLVFMGTQHPNDDVGEMSESKTARQLAKKLKLVDKSVFFLDGWVDYDDRASYLLDANAAIYADKDSIEMRFSHRTRVLDHIWAGLPTICSQGDYLSQVLSDSGMGIVAGERTPDSFAEVIEKAYSNPGLLNDVKANIARERSHFTWKESTNNLVSFIEDCEPGIKAQTDFIVPAEILAKPYSQKAKQRIKNSIKVLLGKIDV